MEKLSIRDKYKPYFEQMAQMSSAADVIDNTNVYQPGNPKTRKIMDLLIKENTTSGSGIKGKENFINFFDQVKAGKHGLILMEHYSNTDLPGLLWSLKNDGDAKLSELSDKVVAIAGMKLNEDNPMVKAFAESFTRVVIYPTRSLDAVEEKVQSPEEKAAEEAKARKINMAAMHAMDDCKRRGEVILVFPSGTRYRPGKPETKRGLREIDSYLRLFDIVILVSINGSILTIDQDHSSDMLADIVYPAKVVYTASPVIECKPFRKEYMESLPKDEADPKQKMIDHVMDLLEEQHDKMQKEY
ncbi:MAG: 1-acyl-sn-glycerol-3-phosphate acyltransferase [Treponema sp.]